MTPPKKKQITDDEFIASALESPGRIKIAMECIAEKERKEADEKARKEAEKAAKAPIKTKMSVWVNSFELPLIDVDNEKTTEIKAKFEAFKSWSLTQIESL